MRSTLSPAFTSSKMKTMFVLMSECCQQLVDFLEQCYQQPPEGACDMQKGKFDLLARNFCVRDFRALQSVLLRTEVFWSTLLCGCDVSKDRAAFIFRVKQSKNYWYYFILNCLVRRLKHCDPPKRREPLARQTTRVFRNLVSRGYDRRFKPNL